jgi:hypothetical protein
MERFLYTSKSGLQCWNLYAGPDGRCPVVLEWGCGVGVIADLRYVPIGIYTVSPGCWCRHHLPHVGEVVVNIDGGGVVADRNGSAAAWVRMDQVWLAVTALRELFRGYPGVPNLHPMLGTKSCRVAGLSRDPQAPLLLEPVVQHVEFDIGVSAGVEVELPPKDDQGAPRLRQSWDVDGIRWILPRGAQVATPDGPPNA